MILCGWCGRPTEPGVCGMCRHADPARPWRQRGEEPAEVALAPGRPTADPVETRRRVADARRQVEARGVPATVDRIAEELDVSPRTVRRWQQRVSE